MEIAIFLSLKFEDVQLPKIFAKLSDYDKRTSEHVLHFDMSSSVGICVFNA